MRFFVYFLLILSSFTLLGADPAFGVTTEPAPGTIAESPCPPGHGVCLNPIEQETEAAAKQLYCETTQAIRGNVGTLLGLLLAIGGFILFLMTEAKWFTVVMMILGIALTAVPGLFAAGMQTYSHLFQGEQSNADADLDTACRKEAKPSP